MKFWLYYELNAKLREDESEKEQTNSDYPHSPWRLKQFAKHSAIYSLSLLTDKIAETNYLLTAISLNTYNFYCKWD